MHWLFYSVCSVMSGGNSVILWETRCHCHVLLYTGLKLLPDRNGFCCCPRHQHNMYTGLSADVACTNSSQWPMNAVLSVMCAVYTWCVRTWNACLCGCFCGSPWRQTSLSSSRLLSLRPSLHFCLDRFCRSGRRFLYIYTSLTSDTIVWLLRLEVLNLYLLTVEIEALVTGTSSKLGEWLIDRLNEYAIFLHWLDQQWRLRQKPNLAQR